MFRQLRLAVRTGIVTEPPAGRGRDRGPIWHWVTAAGSATLARVKVVDPSFRNWPALEYAVLNNIVPDFPLCNKSFNLSYSGSDL